MAPENGVKNDKDRLGEQVAAVLAIVAALWAIGAITERQRLPARASARPA
jgi:hypothetical protein